MDKKTSVWPDGEALEMHVKWSLHRRLGEGDWERILEVLPEKTATRARNVGTIHRFIEASLWVADTGGGWKYMPREFGSWRSNYMRFVRWSQQGLWKRVIPALDSVELRASLSALVQNYLAERGTREMVSNLTANSSN